MNRILQVARSVFVLLAVLVGASLGAAGCGGDPRSLLLVEVLGEPDVPRVESIIIQVRNAERMWAEERFVGDVPRTGDPLKLGIYLHPALHGNTDVIASARDAMDCEIGRGSISGPIVPGKASRARVQVKRTTGPCAGGGGGDAAVAPRPDGPLLVLPADGPTPPPADGPSTPPPLDAAPPPMDLAGTERPVLDSPTVMDGPVMDGPVMDGRLPDLPRDAAVVDSPSPLDLPPPPDLAPPLDTAPPPPDMDPDLAPPPPDLAPPPPDLAPDTMMVCDEVANVGCGSGQACSYSCPAATRVGDLSCAAAGTRIIGMPCTASVGQCEGGSHCGCITPMDCRCMKYCRTNTDCPAGQTDGMCRYVVSCMNDPSPMPKQVRLCGR
jgi:hypothetical protein